MFHNSTQINKNSNFYLKNRKKQHIFYNIKAHSNLKLQTSNKCCIRNMNLDKVSTGFAQRRSKREWFMKNLLLMGKLLERSLTWLKLIVEMDEIDQMKWIPRWIQFMKICDYSVRNWIHKKIKSTSSVGNFELSLGLREREREILSQSLSLFEWFHVVEGTWTEFIDFL